MPKEINLKNKVALVTGASRGIGKAIAQVLAAHNATVALHFARNQTAADRVLDGLDGNRHFTVRGDFAEPETPEIVVRQVVERADRIDILVNNAGIYQQHPVRTTNYENWKKIWRDTLEINLLAPANLMYLAAQQMKISGGGKIINISSRGAFRGEPDASAYGASKGGLNAVSQSLAQALAADGIFVTAVAPGFVETDMARSILDGPEGHSIRSQSPLNRVATPAEVAQLVLFLASDQADFLTGGIIDINGASYLR